MDDELIEKVARAIEEADAKPVEDNCYKGTDDAISDWGWTLARAAIQAVREAGWKSPDEIDSLESAAYDRGYEAGFPEPY